MSDQISEAAWKRAASMETFHFGDIDESGGRNARVVFADDIASLSFYIPRLCVEEAQAELDAADEVTDAMVLAHLNEQQRIGAQDLAFDSLREAVEYIGQSYVDDVRRCLEAALKVTES